MFKKVFAFAMSITFITVIVACAPVAAQPTPIPATAFVPATPDASPTVSITSTATTPPNTPTAAPTAVPTVTNTVVVSPNGKIPVGIILPDSGAFRWRQDQASFRNYFKTAGFSAQISFSQNNVDKEKAIVRSMIKQGIKVIILCPINASAATAEVNEARAAGVRIISYERLIRDTSMVDYYVTFDNIAVGQAQAQYLVDHVKAKGVPLYLYAGDPSDNNTFMFFEGAWSVLQPKIADGTFIIKNSSIAIALQDTNILTRDQQKSIIDQITTNWNPTTAAKLAWANLANAADEDKGDVAILTPNDITARAIGDVFATNKGIKSYIITGQDADKASVQSIINGKQTMTVYKDTRALARDAMEAALAYLTGQFPAQTVTVDNGVIDVPTHLSSVVVVDKSNIKSALIDTGQYKLSDFTGLPK